MRCGEDFLTFIKEVCKIFCKQQVGKKEKKEDLPLNNEVLPRKNTKTKPRPKPIPVKVKPLAVESFIDPNEWKLTLPSTTEIKSAEKLATYSDDNFYLTSDGIVMSSPCDASTTKNTKYPRCELREWTEKDVFWSAMGFHTLTYTAACMHLPKNKPEIVCGQVHDLDDDVFEVKFSGTDIVVFHDKIVYGKLCTDYKLGEFIKFKMVIDDGDVVIEAIREDLSSKKVSFKMVSTENCYFKVGAYVQSNESKGDGDDYGEIVLKWADIQHL